MTKYTDADVARMLGWNHSAHQLWQRVDGRYIDLPIFGLSTTVSADADANTARYVLPWLMQQGYSMLIRLANEYASEYFPSCFCVYITHKEVECCVTKVGDDFASTVCRAALQAWEAKKGSDNQNEPS